MGWKTSFFRVRVLNNFNFILKLSLIHSLPIVQACFKQRLLLKCLHQISKFQNLLKL